MKNEKYATIPQYTLFFYKKVEYKKVILDWPKSSKILFPSLHIAMLIVIIFEWSWSTNFCGNHFPEVRLSVSSTIGLVEFLSFSLSLIFSRTTSSISLFRFWGLFRDWFCSSRSCDLFSANIAFLVVAAGLDVLFFCMKRFVRRRWFGCS